MVIDVPPPLALSNAPCTDMYGEEVHMYIHGRYLLLIIIIIIII